MGKILITGSTGFIGKRLIHHLLEAGHEIYALVRIKGFELKVSNPRFHVLFGDLMNLQSIDQFPEDIDAAFYLVHSMGSVSKDLSSSEKEAALNFVRKIEKTRCRQIVYLGGIIESESDLSPHLESRLAVEKILKASNIRSTILRASLIIGSGSASFEIIRDLVEKLPLMIAPKWVNSLCQPIAIRDVLFYLGAVLLNQRCYDQTFDIGGPEAMSFKDVLCRYANFRGLKRHILVVPLLTPHLSSYWLVLITSVRFSIAYQLVESMKHNTRKLNLAIDRIVPHSCISYERALDLAFQKISQNEVVSTWADACSVGDNLKSIDAFIDAPQEGCLKDVQMIPIEGSVESVKRRIWSVGGERGWYSMDWAWQIRGKIDQLAKGAGLSRGRRHPDEIRVGDSIDFWRVLLADEDKIHLILYAEMRLPGEAWLEFEVDAAKNMLKQTATFRPKGIWGRIYWYFLYPVHWIIFRNMARRIAQGS